MEICLIENGRRIVKRGERPSFSASCDVVVVGLGTAGAAAFLRCVRDGVSVYGIEKGNGLGGLSTVGGICFGGLTKRLITYERAAATAKVAYGTSVVGVWMDGRRVAGVRTLRNGAFCDVAARFAIDATGNATVARMCGCGLRKGRSIDGVMAPCARGETWLDNGAKMGRPIYRNYPDDLTLGARAYSDTIGKLAGERHRFWLSQRKSGRMLRPFAMVGAREEIRVETEAIASMADAICGKVFPDTLFHAFAPEDLPVFYDDHAFESQEIRNWKVHCGLPMFCYPSSVPYGSIVAKGVDNLFVPSKHFGVAHDLGGSLRLQPEMVKTGVAAALAAGIALRLGCAARDVPYAELEPVLRRAGNLDPAQSDRVNTHHGFRFEPFSDEDVVAALRHDVTRTGEWWQGPRGIATGSADERAAYALWTAWERGVRGSVAEREAFARRLAVELDADLRHSGNFAIALALMGDARALPVLREIVSNPGGVRDPAVSGAYPVRIKALDMLGRFADSDSVPVLLGIVEDEAKGFVAGLAAAGAFPGGETTCRFHALSYALMALQAILAKHPDDKTASRIRRWQKRGFVFKAWQDGNDLAPRLRRIRF